MISRSNLIFVCVFVVVVVVVVFFFSLSNRDRSCITISEKRVLHNITFGT